MTKFFVGVVPIDKTRAKVFGSLSQSEINTKLAIAKKETPTSCPHMYPYELSEIPMSNPLDGLRPFLQFNWTMEYNPRQGGRIGLTYEEMPVFGPILFTDWDFDYSKCVQQAKRFRKNITQSLVKFQEELRKFRLCTKAFRSKQNGKYYKKMKEVQERLVKIAVGENSES